MKDEILRVSPAMSKAVAVRTEVRIPTRAAIPSQAVWCHRTTGEVKEAGGANRARL